MVQPLELPIIKGSWEGSQGMGERLEGLVPPGVRGRLQSTFPRDPQVTVPHPARFSRATQADSHVGGGPAAGPPRMGAPGLGAWPTTGPTCAAAAAGARPPVHPETPPARRTAAHTGTAGGAHGAGQTRPRRAAIAPAPLDSICRPPRP